MIHKTSTNKFFNPWIRLVLGCTVLAFIVSLSIMRVQIGANEYQCNKAGNILISDQFNNRVIEVDKDHNIVWQFGDGSTVAGPNSIVGVNDAERVGHLTLMSGTGIPAGADPSCTNPNGCQDNRVIIVNRAGKIVWQYGETGVPGSGKNQLNAPVQANFLHKKNHILITDQGNQRVIEVTKSHKIVWQYGQTGVPGIAENQLNDPNSALLLKNGNILIADEGNNRVIEVTRSHKIVWQYGDPNDTTILNGPAFASRLKNGHTLITDAGNNRILEITRKGEIVWTYVTNTRTGSVANPLPTRAVRLANGNTLISDQFNEQVIEVNQSGEIIFSYGMIGVPGNGFNELNAPYDAKVIGDFTGLAIP